MQDIIQKVFTHDSTLHTFTLIFFGFMTGTLLAYYFAHKIILPAGEKPVIPYILAMSTAVVLFGICISIALFSKLAP